MAPGSTFNAQDPSYAWRFQQGLVGLERANAASGNTGSGSEMAAATQYGQNMASTEYGNQFSRMSQLAGGNIGSPAAAGQILAGAGQQQQMGATALGTNIGQAASSGFPNWFNQPSGGSSSGGFGGQVDLSNSGQSMPPQSAYGSSFDSSSWGA
jgi:hypothetical protein